MQKGRRTELMGKDEDTEKPSSVGQTAAGGPGKTKPKAYVRKRGLSMKQRMASPLLLDGERDQAVARRLSLHRVTITNWRTRDFKFQAEFNRRARERAEELENQSRALRA